ncbi:hypothetical protein Y699_09308 [Aspergillus fumigatus Z5]|nr:hypothetical protein Y699_09308 [Aspergillus fumigatus Z5]
MAQSINAKHKESINLPTQTYEGSCHCKAWHLVTVAIVTLQEAYSHLWKILRFIKGRVHLSEYRFGSHTIQIFFCGSCGANVYNKSLNPKFRYGAHAVNVRLLHGVDLETIKITKTDGKSLQLPPLAEGPL